MAPSGTVVEKQLVTWAAGATAAAAIGYVLLGNYLPSFRWSNKMDETVPGLYNRYGNDCFANCVIQALAGIPSFRQYLKDRIQKDKGGELKLDRPLMDLLKALNVAARKQKTKSIERVIFALEELYNSRINRNQQDCQEFLHLIHEALDVEDNKIKKQHPNSEPLQIPANPFEGELSSQIQCQRCSFLTPWKKESFTELSVSVPTKWSCTLPECLSSLITTDSIPDYACPLCTLENTLLSLELIPTKSATLLQATSRLRQLSTTLKRSSGPTEIDIDAISLPATVEWKRIKTPATKRTVISRAPQVLAVHLVRSIYERGYGAGRNGCEVAFEEDIAISVDGEEAERRKNEEAVDDEEDYTPKYRLMSVITHKGWHDGGHYICYRRRKREKKHKKSHGEEKGNIIINTEEKGKDVRHSMEKVADSDESLEKGIVGLGMDTSGIEQVDSRTKWWEISDEVVVGVHKDDVLAKRKGVYILFYERKL